MEQEPKIKRESRESKVARIRPYQWKKGQSGNAKGHPLGQPNYATLRDRAIRLLGKQNGKTPQQIEEEIIANALLEARKGNFQFYKDDKDRTFGSATQKTELTGADGGPIQIEGVEISIRK